MSTGQDLSMALRHALKADPQLDADDIELDVSPIGLLLNGTVRSQEQVSRATATANGVPGVAAVHNLLAVGLLSKDYGDDAALAHDANEACRFSSGVSPRDSLTWADTSIFIKMSPALSH